jgi:phosphatidylinositol alpha-1,6-mannosyltransferase
MTAKKGQDKLVEAFPRVLAKVPNAKLLLVGEGIHLFEIIAEAHELGLKQSALSLRYEPPQDCVIFTGGVPWELVPAYFQAADVAVAVSRPALMGLGQEGFGMVSIEAAACGKPVVVGQNGGAPETVIDAVTGFVVDPNNPKEIAARLIELLTQPQKAQQMGRRGRERVLTNFTWDQIASHLISLLR